MKRPKPLQVIDLKPLIRLTKEYLKQVSIGYVDDDMDYYIFEETLKAIYGPDIFQYINERLR